MAPLPLNTFIVLNYETLINIMKQLYENKVKKKGPLELRPFEKKLAAALTAIIFTNTRVTTLTCPFSATTVTLLWCT